MVRQLRLAVWGGEVLRMRERPSCAVRQSTSIGVAGMTVGGRVGGACRLQTADSERSEQKLRTHRGWWLRAEPATEAG